MRIEWLSEAERGLAAQLEWIAEQGPWAAVDMGDAIHAAIPMTLELAPPRCDPSAVAKRCQLPRRLISRSR